MEYIMGINHIKSPGLFFAIYYSSLHMYLIVEYFLNRDLKKDYIDLEKTNNLKSKEIHRIKLLNEKLILELKGIKLLLNKGS